VLDLQELFESVVVLNALFASMAWCLARPNWASMLSTLAFAVIWPFVDTPVTGRLLLTLSDDKGVTQSDLISVLAVIVVAVQRARPIIKARVSGAQAEQGQSG
jgi:hypothetical protein